MKIRPWAVSALMVLGLAQLQIVQVPGQLSPQVQTSAQRGAGGTGGRGGGGRGTSAAGGVPGGAGVPGVPSFPMSSPVFGVDAGNAVPALVADLTLNCSSDLRWINAPVPGANPKVVSRANDIASLNLISIVGKPDNCLPAEIRLNVYYFDANESLICSGVMSSAMTQNPSPDPNSGLNSTMTANLEIKPYSLPEFFRWRNGPRPQALSTRRLVCVDPDGLTEVGQEFDFATSVRVYASLIPRGGSISTAEIRLNLGF